MSEENGVYHEYGWFEVDGAFIVEWSEGEVGQREYFHYAAFDIRDDAVIFAEIVAARSTFLSFGGPP